ncbi:MAG: hypothetical protein GY861_19085 [bacterium]|nr:hypothetical protein [bacterium]
MADTNRVQISYLEEATWGVTPSSALTDMRYTSEDFIYNVANITSEEIRSDRNVTDMIQTGADPSGGFNFELSFGSPADVFWESALFGEFTADVGFSQSSDVSASSNAYASSGNNFDLTTAEDVGRWVYVSGFANAVNNGWKQIVTAAVGALTVVSPTTMVVEAAGALTITINGKRLRNGIRDLTGTHTTGAASATLVDSNASFTNAVIGRTIYNVTEGESGTITAFTSTTITATLSGSETWDVADEYIIKGVLDNTEKSFSMQREATDVAQFFLFRGMVVNTTSVNATSNAVATGSMSMMGKDAALAQTTWGTGANTAAPTEDVMNAVANVGNIMFDGTPLSDFYFQELTFSTNNNLRGLAAIGTLGYIDIGSGRFEVTGGMNVYFADDTLYDIYLAGSTVDVSFSVSDEALNTGNSYHFSFEKVKIETDSGAQATGSNADVMENLTWRATYNPTTRCTMEINYYDAP